MSEEIFTALDSFFEALPGPSAPKIGSVQFLDNDNRALCRCDQCAMFFLPIEIRYTRLPSNDYRSLCKTCYVSFTARLAVIGKRP